MTLQEFSDKSEALGERLKRNEITEREYQLLKSQLTDVWAGNINKIIGK